MMLKLHTHLIQLSGSFLQSVLHLNLSQASQPIGGVLARPFSSAGTEVTNDKITQRIRKQLHGILRKRNETALSESDVEKLLPTRQHSPGSKQNRIPGIRRLLRSLGEQRNDAT